MRHASRAFAVAALVGPLWVAAAAAQTRPAAAAPSPPPSVAPNPSLTTATYGDWVLRCDAPQTGNGQRICQATQTVQVRGQSTPIAQIAFGHAASNEPVKFVVVLPVDVMFPSVVTIAIGDKDPEPVQLAWHRCVPVGCFAEAVSTADAVKRWRGESGEGKLTFKDAVGRDVVVPVSFRGLAQALDALARQ